MARRLTASSVPLTPSGVCGHHSDRPSAALTFVLAASFGALLSWRLMLPLLLRARRLRQAQPSTPHAYAEWLLRRHG